MVKQAGYSPVHLDVATIADRAVSRFADRYPKIWRRYSPVQRARLREDFFTQARYLRESIATGSADIFTDYVTWIRAVLKSEVRPEDYLQSMVEILDEVLQKDLHPDFRRPAATILKEGRKALKKSLGEIPSFITKNTPFERVARSYLDALIKGDQKKARNVIEEELEIGVAVRNIYLRVLQPVLMETGRFWQLGKVTIAQEHFVTAHVQATIGLLHERIVISKKEKRKRKILVASCVGDELHDIGIRIVADFFAMDGWETYFIGGNVPVRSLIQAVGERKADVLAISATMPFHLSEVQYLIRSLRADPETKKVKIITGGYPFSVVPDLWRQVGADAFAKDADEAVKIGNQITSVRRRRNEQ